MYADGRAGALDFMLLLHSRRHEREKDIVCVVVFYLSLSLYIYLSIYINIYRTQIFRARVDGCWL